MSEPQTVRAQDGREGTSKSDPGSLERRHLPGTVNLSGRGHRSACHPKVGGLYRNAQAADFRPDVESLRPDSSVLGGSSLMAAKMK